MAHPFSPPPLLEARLLRKDFCFAASLTNPDQTHVPIKYQRCYTFFLQIYISPKKYLFCYLWANFLCLLNKSALKGLFSKYDIIVILVDFCVNFPMISSFDWFFSLPYPKGRNKTDPDPQHCGWLWSSLLRLYFYFNSKLYIFSSHILILTL